MKVKSILVFVVVLLFHPMARSFATTPRFQGLGDLPGSSFYSDAWDVSADGTVVGYSKSASSGVNFEAFRWTAQSGIVGLGDLAGGIFGSGALGISADGSAVVGVSGSGSGTEAFRWTAFSGMVGLGDLAGGSFKSFAYGVSNDGSVVVGCSSSTSSGNQYCEAFRWTAADGILGLGDFAGGMFYSKAKGISANGSVIVGHGYSTSGFEAFRWTTGTGMVGLGDLPGGAFFSNAEDVSADGSVVVGDSVSLLSGSYCEAFRWTAFSGMVGLGDLPGGKFDSRAYAVSADGSVVVGRSSTASGDEAFLWTETNGMVNLRDMLMNEYALDLTAWTLKKATGISDDGLIIVGYGTNPNGYTEAWIATIPAPATAPVADADGPYSIYVGDTLILDASGSTDDDNDIVSYMWDLNDNGSFETDAGGQAVFDVNYTSLQSLGLIINYTYTIHLKVTDSVGQSDVNDSTLTILPKPAVKVAVDIKPGSCPNPVNVKSSGVLPVAVLGTGDYDVTTIDPTSVRLAGVEPLRSGYEDVATPVSDANDCNCIEAGPDGLLDLTLKFATQRIVEAIGDVNDGDVLTLELTGVLYDPIPFETPIEGADCILIKGWHKAHNKADINKDGVVDMTDFAIISENWLAGK